MTLNKKIMVWTGVGLIGLAAAVSAVALTWPERPGRYAAFDLNGDSEVSLAEIRQIGQRRFEVFDVDANGALSGAEIPLMLRGEGSRRDGAGGPDRRANPAPDAEPGNAGTVEAQPVNAVPLDFNGDGTVQAAEFVANFAAPFALADIDGNEVLSEDEIRSSAIGRQGRMGDGRDDRRGDRH